MHRRSFFQSILSASAGAALVLAGPYRAAASGFSKSAKLVTLVEFSNTGQRQGVTKVERVVKTDDEWRHQLTPEQFDIARGAGTERAFTGKNWNNHERGIYRCVCCANALFSSDTKFESGTGWPSFYEPLAKQNVEERVDASLGATRTEVRCTKCEAHLGHVFDDGPRPTGLRYCMNGNVLDFVKA